MNIVVARERHSRMTCAIVVPRRGTTGQLVARRAHAFLRELRADRTIAIVRSDRGLR